ncbi:MAG: hypothetical protein H6867_10625 [Rhodospirillales bacterium]|nr:hypothetical protein [Rhodospirillales bacterium]MCB9995763.1 hypothetical protein [Rhodospirillales bacterium]
MDRRQESGNVLFLVLIAVTLFAALTFAVGQVTRGSSGTDSGRETDLLGSAALLQYAASLRGVVLQMMINGTAAEDLEFIPPVDLANCTTPENCVYHTLGGAAVYQQTSPSVMENGLQGNWIVNGDFEIENIGINRAADFQGNDIIAFLPGVSQEVCERINERLNISPMPVFNDRSLSLDLVNMDETYIPPVSEIIIGPSSGSLMAPGSADALLGRAEGCYYDNDGALYVYYQALIER